MTTVSPAPAAMPEVLRGADEIEALVPAWRALVIEAGAPVFASPDWLLPWRRHYGGGADTFLLAWRSGDTLLGVLPMAVRTRRLPPHRELAPWGSDGTALRGMVDLVTRPGDREPLARGLAGWVAGAQWDVMSVLRLPPGSSTGPSLAAAARSHGWRLVSNTGVVRSDTYILDLPDATGADPHVLGAKARHNLRTEARRFERQGGRYEAVIEATAVPEVVAAIRRLSAERWGAGERTFREDPAAEPFLVDALRAMAAQGSFRADIARDATGIRAALVTLAVGRRAVALAIGVSAAEDVRRLSLGKQLFAASIEGAIQRGAQTYDFLWVGGYKETFWGARPQRMESLLLARGPAGRLVAWRAARRRGASFVPPVTGAPADGSEGAAS